MNVRGMVKKILNKGRRIKTSAITGSAKNLSDDQIRMINDSSHFSLPGRLNQRKKTRIEVKFKYFNATSTK
jgi:hypothetical protein